MNCGTGQHVPSRPIAISEAFESMVSYFPQAQRRWLEICSSLPTVPRWAERLEELAATRSGRLLDIRSPYDAQQHMFH